LILKVTIMPQASKVLLITLAAAMAALAAPARGQLVRLNAQASVDARTDVRLGDIATVSGTDRRTAEELSNTVILSGVESSRTLKAESILLALMSQRGPQNLANLQLGGSAQCTISVVSSAPATRPSPMASPKQVTPVTPVAAEPAPTRVVTASVMAAAPAAAPAELSLQQVIEARVQQEATASGDRLRVSIESLAPQLATPVAAGRKWICRPLTRTFLGTVTFEAQLVEGTRVLDKLNIQTKIERFQQVVVSVAKLDRGDIISASTIRVEEAWLDRNLPTLVASDKDILGLETSKALSVGTMLDSRDFRPALMAVKGDAINVIYLSGNLKVQMRGRAMEDGKLHEAVALRNETTGDTYQATLIGKRLAVVGGTLTEAEEQKLRETR
jgi:flagella basal body P-ring formation protein FlgA